MPVDRAKLAVGVAAGVPVEEAARIAGAKDSNEGWNEYEALTGGMLILANRNLFGSVGITPEKFARTLAEGLEAKKYVQVSGGTKDTPAEFEEVDDHPTRLNFARAIARYTGIDPGDKLDINVKQTTITATVNLTEVVETGTGADLLAALREHRGL